MTSRYFKSLAIIAMAVTLRSVEVSAQEVVSGIFGYNHFTLLGNSDTIVSLPFARTPAATAVASSTSGSDITVSGTPGWTAGQYVYSAGVQSNRYFVRIESGALEGKWFNITNNTTDTLNLDLNGGSLTGMVSGDKLAIVPHWTLATVFVNGNGVHQTALSTLGNPPTQVLVPDLSTANKNNAPIATYYYYTNAGVLSWRLVGGGATSKNDEVVQPNTYLVVRHNVSTNTTFTSYGDVILTKVSVALRANSSNQVDNATGLPRPVTVSLAQAGLYESGSFVPTTNLAALKDQILVYDNSKTNKNKSSAGTYYYYNSGWRKSGSATSIDFGTSNVFTPGAGFIIRKAAGGSSGSWANSATYTNQ